MFISLQHDDFTLVINEQLFQYLQIHLPPDLVIMHEFKLIKLKKTATAHLILLNIPS